jgi:predicted deacylase
VGYISITRSRDTSAWAFLRIPFVSIASGEGPTVLVIGGTHGDEYEGQLAASWLARTLSPDEVTGRVLVIPFLSREASAAGTRHWPDGENMNRVFPGEEDGSTAERIAYLLSTEIFPRCDAVIDIHSGGRSMVSLPVSHMHREDDAALREQMERHMKAWNTGYHFVYGGVGGSSERLLPGNASSQGKIVVTTELGGGGIASAATVKIAREGLANVLRSLGVLKGEVIPPVPPSKILDATDAESYVESPLRGVYENAVAPGDTVTAGATVGFLHDMDDVERAPLPLTAAHGGIVIMSRGLPIVEPGDVVAVIGRDRPVGAAG